MRFSRLLLSFYSTALNLSANALGRLLVDLATSLDVERRPINLAVTQLRRNICVRGKKNVVEGAGERFLGPLIWNQINRVKLSLVSALASKFLTKIYDADDDHFIAAGQVRLPCWLVAV